MPRSQKQSAAERPAGTKKSAPTKAGAAAKSGAATKARAANKAGATPKSAGAPKSAAATKAGAATKPAAGAKAGASGSAAGGRANKATRPTKAEASSVRSRPAKQAPGPPAAARPPAERAGAEGELPRAEFLDQQRVLLVEERASYTRQAEELKAEADSLALEHEPGDVQFDEEGGEGGTSNVDRELDLVLSAQARAAITEIDRALAKMEAGTYGACEQCGQDIPQARLAALPYAALCVGCKSGGLSRRA